MKTVLQILILTAFLLVSCKNDEEPSIPVNTPPSQVSNIIAEVIPNTATVAISWNAAIDDQGDQVRYDVIINKELVKTNLTGTSTEIDVSEFITITGKGMREGKGLEVELEIEIKAYDPSNSFSNTSVTKTFFINRQPSDFAFESINFNTDSFAQLDVSWRPASDPDGDTLSYTVYLNDIVLIADYQIPEGENFGILSYTESFLEFSTSEIVLKVVVTDTSGESKEISESYNFKATDIDLGALDTYNEEFSFSIPVTEADHRIGYSFNVSEQTNYNINNSSGVLMQIKDAQNRTIVESSSLSGVLEPGSYTLVLIGKATETSSGTITLALGNSTSTDVDLGAVVVPSNEIYELTFENEEDNTINYYFEVTEFTGYQISATFISNLYDENGTLVHTNLNSNTNQFLGEEIPYGKYRLEVIKPNSYGIFTSTIQFVFADVTLTNQDLGKPTNNQYHTISYEANEFELDRKVAFHFETEEITSLWINPLLSVHDDIELLDSDGNSIGENLRYGFLQAIDLPVGEYKLVYEFGLGGPILDFEYEFLLQQSTFTDEDWGIISTPFSSGYFSYPERKFDPDLKVVYTFETTEVAPRWYYFSSDNSGDLVYFTDEDGNEVPQNATGPAGSETPAGTDLPPGKYKIEVIDRRGAGRSYGISFTFNLY